MRSVVLGLVFIFLSSIFSGQVALAQPVPKFQRIDPDVTLIGHEATFQDSKMALGDEELTMSTPYKLKIFKKMIALFRANSEESTRILADHISAWFKPGVTIGIGNSEKAVVTMEPGCIEWNLTPKHLGDLVSTWTPIFRTASRAGLVPIAVALFGGGGHFHVGGETAADNPFIKYPNLLRNLIGYFHNHPSLLYAFGEAYDFGPDASARNTHEPGMSAELEAAAEIFDQKYKLERYGSADAATFLSAMGKSSKLYELFTYHDAVINLEHFKSFKTRKTNAKLTVEFRGFRSMASPRHVFEAAKMLFQILDRLSDPDLLVPVNHFTDQDSLNTLSASVVEDDWRQVKKEMGIRSPLLDDMVLEYTHNDDFIWEIHPGGVKSRDTYSEFKRRGKNIEVLVPYTAGKYDPNTIIYEGIKYAAVPVFHEGKKYLVAVVNTSDFAGFQVKLHPCATLLRSR